MSTTEFGKDWQAFVGFVAEPGKKDLTYFGTFADIANKKMIVADELYFNDAAPTGDMLAAVSKAIQDKGFETGVTITPAVMFNIDWKNGTSTLKSPKEIEELCAKLLKDIESVDFVGVDPYKGIIPGVSDEFLIDFTHMMDDVIHSLGKDATLVVQGFARHGDECETLAYIEQQLKGQSYDDVVVFGLEDGPDLNPIDFVGINPLPVIIDCGM